MFKASYILDRPRIKIVVWARTKVWVRETDKKKLEVLLLLVKTFLANSFHWEILKGFDPQDESKVYAIYSDLSLSALDPALSTQSSSILALIFFLTSI